MRSARQVLLAARPVRRSGHRGDGRSWTVNDLLSGVILALFAAGITTGLAARFVSIHGWTEAVSLVLLFLASGLALTNAVLRVVARQRRSGRTHAR